LRCPFGIVLVGLGHVGSHRAVAPPICVKLRRAGYGSL
jgi:hypothetical protein